MSKCAAVIKSILNNNCVKWSYDPCSYGRNFSNCGEKLEKFRTSTDFEPVTSRCRCHSGFGPPGPDPLTDFDPLSRIWIPLKISVLLISICNRMGPRAIKEGLILNYTRAQTRLRVYHIRGKIIVGGPFSVHCVLSCENGKCVRININ